VLSFKFSAGRQFSASKSASSPSAKTLVAILGDMRILVTIMLSSIHIVLFGQSKNCYDISSNHKISKCYLIPSRVINDTFITYLPQNCDLKELDSTLTGVWKVFLFDSSTIIEILTTKKGRLNGSYKSFYKQNGQISVECKYINDTIIGKYTSYYENGKTKKNGICNSKGLTGFQYEYWDNGVLAHRAKLTEGKYRGFRDEKYWDLNGRRIDYFKFYSLWHQCD